MRSWIPGSRTAYAPRNDSQKTLRIDIHFQPQLLRRLGRGGQPVAQIARQVEGARRLHQQAKTVTPPHDGERQGYPPFGRLASLIVSGGDRHSTESYARQIARAAPNTNDVMILGPAEAPLAIVRGRHRFRLLVKSARAFDLSGYLRDWLSAAPKPTKKLGLEVDVDPQSFL